MFFYNGNVASNGFGCGIGASGGGNGSALICLYAGVAFIASTYTWADTTTFHNVAITRSASTTSWYVDGTAKGTNSAKTPLTPTTGTYLGQGGTGSQKFMGAIDEFSMWSRVLTAGEITALAIDNRLTGYKHTGNWISPAETMANQTPGSVTVTWNNINYGGPPSHATIVFVTIEDTSGHVYYNDSLGWTASPVYIQLPGDITLPNPWKIRIGLGGNGDDTPSITSIVIGLNYQASAATPTDYMPIWILTALVVLLFLVGTKLPFLWIFSGIAGLLLAIQIYNTLADPVLSTVIAGFGVMLMIVGIFRRG
jgi:hypothetical protein